MDENVASVAMSLLTYVTFVVPEAAVRVVVSVVKTVDVGETAFGTEGLGMGSLMTTSTCVVYTKLKV